MQIKAPVPPASVPLDVSRVCSTCVIDDTDPEARFDDNGVCQYCRFCADFMRTFGGTTESRQARLEALVNRIKAKGAGKPYDCILGLSGGVDSSYVALIAKRLGLRPLAVHCDTGWNSETAVRNIERIVTKLDLNLVTVVCDWEEMRDLQRAFLKSGVVNCDIPQDHTLGASLYRTAAAHSIKYILSGENFSTESILPKAWRGHMNRDLTYILSIHRRFGELPLRTLPRLRAFDRLVVLPHIRGVKKVTLLDLFDYSRDAAIEELSQELDWRSYGPKHGESLFTRFFQCYYLPVRFGIDKRKAHFSSLIASGQMTREAALAELKTPVHLDPEVLRQKAFVLKKLGFSDEEFHGLLVAPMVDESEFRSSAWLFTLKDDLSLQLGRVVAGLRAQLRKPPGVRSAKASKNSSGMGR